MKILVVFENDCWRCGGLALPSNDGLCQHCKNVYRNNPDIEKWDKGEIILPVSRFQTKLLKTTRGTE